MYQPNFNDPRIRTRCLKALEWTVTNISGRPYAKSKKEIQTHFGNGSRQPGQWLRELLLTSVDPYWNKELGICKRWVANKDGIAKLEQLLNLKPQLPKIKPEIEQQLETGDLEYTDKGNRLFHPVQFYPKRIKLPLLAKHGMTNHYDIKCAAPTLIKQYAIQLGMTKATPALDQYLADRTSVRQRIANDCNISESTAKDIINALLTGAKLGCNREFGIFSLLNGDHSKVKWLQQDEFILQIKEDIKVCWDYIKKGTGSSMKLIPKNKSEVYLKLERQVLNETKKFLKRKKMKFVLEHDGWSCDSAIDPYELRVHIRNNTGFMIDYDWFIYE